MRVFQIVARSGGDAEGRRRGQRLKISNEVKAPGQRRYLYKYFSVPFEYLRRGGVFRNPQVTNVMDTL